MRPPHPVWKSKLSNLAWMINKVLDHSNYFLPIKDVRKAADGERALQFVCDNLPTLRLLDMSLLTPEDEAAINHWLMGLNGNCDFDAANQRLCLLLSWTIELMQHAGDPGDFD